VTATFKRRISGCAHKKEGRRGGGGRKEEKDRRGKGKILPFEGYWLHPKTRLAPLRPLRPLSNRFRRPRPPVFLGVPVSKGVQEMTGGRRRPALAAPGWRASIGGGPPPSGCRGPRGGGRGWGTALSPSDRGRKRTRNRRPSVSNGPKSATRERGREKTGRKGEVRIKREGTAEEGKKAVGQRRR